MGKIGCTAAAMECSIPVKFDNAEYSPVFG